MSATQIPNLLSLRGRGGQAGRGGGRGRGRGRGRFGGGGSPFEDDQHSCEESRLQRDETIRQTDDDANGSRLSAVAAGLLTDPFAGYFGDLSKAPKRMPIIIRGTFVRTRAINRLVDNFIDSCAEEGTSAQILSLGAGTDTRIFNLLRRGVSNLIYREVDLAENVSKKISTINKHPELRRLLTGSDNIYIAEGVSSSPTNVASSYMIQALDLRDIDPESSFGENTPAAIKNIAPNIPLLILSECCFCYLQPQTVKKVLSYILSPGGILDSNCRAGLIFYEPINPSDSFGLTMIRNLRQRGIEMPTLPIFPTLARQKSRFAEYGMSDGAKAIDVDRASKLWFTEDEQEEASRKNPLDEVEEWQMLGQHYCISWGWRGLTGWSSWQSMRE